MGREGVVVAKGMVSFRLDAAEQAQLEAIACAMGDTTSGLVRRVLNDFMRDYLAQPGAQKTVVQRLRAKREEETRKFKELEAALTARVQSPDDTPRAKARRSRTGT
jgi:hypothetical protein